MTLKTRLFASFVAMLLMVTMMSTGVLAASNATAVRFDQNYLTMDPDDTETLALIFSPSNASVSSYDYKFESSDKNIAYVDDNGTVYAYEPGTCTISFRLSGTSISTSISVTVRGTPKSSSSENVYTTDDAIAAGLITYRSSPSSKSSKASSTTSSSSKSSTIKLTEKASREEVISSARNGKPLKNYASVSTESLQAASGSVSFDTMSGSSVAGRLTINPENAKNLSGDIQTGVYTGTGNTQKTQNSFDKWFKNTTKVILCDQKNFGMNVDVAVKIGNMSASNLYFYSYDSSTKQYAPLTVSNVSKDSNKYLHFTTNIGGYIIVSDGMLAK